MSDPQAEYGRVLAEYPAARRRDLVLWAVGLIVMVLAVLFTDFDPWFYAVVLTSLAAREYRNRHLRRLATDYASSAARVTR